MILVSENFNHTDRTSNPSDQIINASALSVLLALKLSVIQQYKQAEYCQ